MQGPCAGSRFSQKDVEWPDGGEGTPCLEEGAQLPYSRPSVTVVSPAPGTEVRLALDTVLVLGKP